jgi:hypothetical protein
MAVRSRDTLTGGFIALRRERYGACPAECLREPREHRQVGVKPDALEAAGAEGA